MEDIKESTMKLTNNGFFQHVFNFDTDTQKYLMNTAQYVAVALAPTLLINKVLSDVFSDYDNTKGNLELLAEVVGHLVALMVGLFFVHRLVTYVPTYSGVDYENINMFSVVLAVLLVLYNTQSKLGSKMELLSDRIGELWNGKEDVVPIEKDKNKGTVTTQQPISGLSQPVPTHQTSRADYVMSHGQMQQPVQQQETHNVAQNDPYGGGDPFENSMMEPMAANGVLGSAW
tara:strand:- start:567 stop:1256 length:690 start_codon:yes stop_codon:yes gene_type:complete